MTRQEETKSYCSKCNKCLTDEGGLDIIGGTVEISGLDNSPFLRDQLGKYAPKKGNHVVFNFCYECWLNSLFTNSPYWEGFDR